MKSLQTLRHDFPAGIVVFFVAVPLCLGIALASGAPLFSGLIAGIVGGLVVAAISGSATGVSGPAAGLAVIVLQAIETLGFEAFLLAVVISGVIQMILGGVGAGVLGYFFPSAVISGMLAGIGLIIILKQLPHAAGYDSDPIGDVQFSQSDGETTFSALSQMLNAMNVNAIIVASIALLILIVWEKVLMPRAKVFRLIQGPLVAVTFGIAWQILTTQFAPTYAISPVHLVSVPAVDSFGGFISLFTTPDFSKIGTSAIWVTALTIAVVGSLETLLSLDASDKMDPQKRISPANRELVAQGVGNVLAGLIGGLPITQVIVRSSANVQSGAKSKLAAMIHGAFLLLAVVLLPRVLNLIPLAVLASVLLMVGYKLIKPALFIRLYKAGPSQFLPFLATVLGIVFTDLLTGVELGTVLAIVVILHRNYANSYFLHKQEVEEGGHQVIRFLLAEEVTFLNKGAILSQLADVPDGSEVVIDLRKCITLDHDVREIIDDFVASTKQRKINVRVKEQSHEERERLHQLMMTSTTEQAHEYTR